MTHFGSAALLAAITLTVGACAAILDIEDAEVDPTLDLDGNGPAASGGTGADGGSAGGGGTAPNGGGGGGGTEAGGAAPTAGSGGAPTTGGTGGAGGAGGTGGAGGAAASGGTAGAGGSGPAPLCNRYCEAVMAGCSGANQVYASLPICMKACEAIPAGAEGDTNVSTVECRLAQAVFATDTGEPASHCPAAGPGGNGVCGDDCEGFCALMTVTCSQPGYETTADCLTACAPLGNLGAYDTSIQSGPSVQCRLYHVSAATQAPGTHCPHAAGATPCAP